jgi:hypothetical protein
MNSKADFKPEIRPEIIEYAVKICEQFENFKKRGGYTNIQINRLTVIYATQSWQDDLQRYCAYHPIKYERLSQYKQLAYLVYWLTKTKPIFFQLGHADINLLDPKFQDSDYAAINEVFAFTLCVNLLHIDIDNINKSLYKDMYKRFRYDLFYRDICPKQLFLTLELLHKTLVIRH